MIAQTPEPPYYAVIFTSLRIEQDNGYNEMADFMLEIARQQDGFLGIEAARKEIGITVSYWRDRDSIRRWKEHTMHVIAREKGRESWYSAYKVRIARVEKDYDFGI